MSISFTKFGKFSVILSNRVSIFVLHSLFSFLHPHNANVDMLEVVSEAPYTILIVLGSFFFLLF